MKKLKRKTNLNLSNRPFQSGEKEIQSLKKSIDELKAIQQSKFKYFFFGLAFTTLLIVNIALILEISEIKRHVEIEKAALLINTLPSSPLMTFQDFVD
jgi:hypothetical protein